MISKIINTLRRFKRSKLALALPVTFLILFITTLSLVSATYYFSIMKIGTEGQMVKVSTAKQDLLSLNDKILSTIWSPGSSSTTIIKDSGGSIKIEPESNQLQISVDDASSIQETIFTSPIGKVVYELPYSGTSEYGLFLAGDSRTIVNQTGSTRSQLSIVRGSEHPEIHLSFRPVVSYINAGLENGKQVNDIRIFVTNLNSSIPLDSRGELPLIIRCLDAQLVSRSYEITYQSSNLAITAIENGATGSISVPISSTAQGAIINLEIVVVNVAIERWIR